MDINAELIKNSRTERNWTQQHLADACGVSLRTVQRVERYGNASNETVMALASVFEMNREDIVVPETPVIETELLSNSSGSKVLQFISVLVTGMVIGATLVTVLTK